MALPAAHLTRAASSPGRLRQAAHAWAGAGGLSEGQGGSLIPCVSENFFFLINLAHALHTSRSALLARPCPRPPSPPHTSVHGSEQAARDGGGRGPSGGGGAAHTWSATPVRLSHQASTPPPRPRPSVCTPGDGMEWFFWRKQSAVRGLGIRIQKLGIGAQLPVENTL